MSHSANVRSLDAIRDFRSALIKFIEEAKRGIATADSEVLRTKTWLESTQPLHWLHEVRKSEEQLAQAKSELFRATISQPDNPRGPTDQVRLVRMRQSQIKNAQDRLQLTKRWSRTFERQINEYRGAMTPLTSILDGQLNKALAILERSIQTLESYIATTAPSAADELVTPNDVTSIARSGDEAQKENPTNEHANSEDATSEGDKGFDPSLESNE